MACSALPERLARLQPAVEAGARDLRAGLDEAPAQRALLDDLDVGVDAADVGQVDVEAREVGEAAHRVERRLLLQPRLQRAQVHRRADLLQVEHGAVDALVALEVEVGVHQPAGHLGQGPRLEQDAGEHGPLGLLAVGQRARGLQRFENGHGAAGSLAGTQAGQDCKGSALKRLSTEIIYQRPYNWTQWKN